MLEFLSYHLYELFWVFAVLCALIFYIRCKKRIRAFLLGCVTGLAALLLLHCFGNAIGCAPNLNTANLAVSALLGVPGAALVMASQYFL